jgi:hypothetical protein
MAANELLNEPAEMAGTEPLDVVEVEAFVVVLDDELPQAATNAPTSTASSAVRIQWRFTIAPSSPDWSLTVMDRRAPSPQLG